MPEYYGITYTEQKTVRYEHDRPIIRPDWYIVSGPCATEDEAEQAAFAAFGENDKSFFWSTRYKNLRIVSKSSLRKYGIKSENHGGARPGAGRKSGPRRRLELDKETAKSLYQLTKLRCATLDRPELSEEDIVKSLVEAEWQKVESELRQDVLALLDNHPDKTFTPSYLAQELDVPYNTTKSAMRRMAVDGQIKRVAHGMYQTSQAAPSP